ncbi:MAG: hypothetical protein ABI156_14280 [Caldimonas sp.]
MFVGHYSASLVAKRLWNHIVLSTAPELALLIGAAVWLHVDRAVWRQSGGRALGGFVAMLVVLHAVGLFGSRPH